MCAVCIREASASFCLLAPCFCLPSLSVWSIHPSMRECGCICCWRVSSVHEKAHIRGPKGKGPNYGDTLTCMSKNTWKGWDAILRPHSFLTSKLMFSPSLSQSSHNTRHLALRANSFSCASRGFLSCECEASLYNIHCPTYVYACTMQWLSQQQM